MHTQTAHPADHSLSPFGSRKGTGTPLLELRKVTCAYEPASPAIQDISLSVDQGEILCLLGPSGCGKTTTLRAIAGFEKVVRGEISLDGEVVSSPAIHRPPERRRVGMVFQDYALFPHLSIADNIGFGLAEWSRLSRSARIAELLELVGLTGLERRYPHEVSGGQQQRTALARALAPHPVMVLMDEPFSNLDPDMTVKMRKELHGLLHQTGTTSILVTHDHEEAFAMADRIAVFREGHLVQWDTPETIYHLPACPFVAEFVGQADFLPGTLRNGRVETELGSFPNPGGFEGGPEVLVMVRPDDLRILRGGTGSACIDGRQFRGSENLYSIRLASGHVVHCSEPSMTIYEPGTRVTLDLIATHTVLFDNTSQVTDHGQQSKQRRTSS